jgi:hypothetical protein
MRESSHISQWLALHHVRTVNWRGLVTLNMAIKGRLSQDASRIIFPNDTKTHCANWRALAAIIAIRRVRYVQHVCTPALLTVSLDSWQRVTVQDATGRSHCTLNPSNWREHMNGYKAFYRGKTLDVRADTTREAQAIAAQQFKARKTYEVDVYLCELNGEQVTHSTASL